MLWIQMMTMRIDSDVFSMPPVAEIRKIIKELVQRLQASNDTGTQLTPVGDSGEVSNRQCDRGHADK